MFALMEEIICRHIGEITQSLGTVRNFTRFLDIPERSGEDIEIDDIPDINLKDVSFVYPSSNKLTINNINLHVKSGETIAIVGENGAGKTTLVKLMTGLYLPTNGDIFIAGYDTMLSREFDGIDLSGGQWQRIAIARGFYSKHSMIVLDEPTSAIDPVEESKIYNKFKEMSEGNTSIIVTHRLGSARIADRIIVMDKGKIIEFGTHDELIKNKGKYEETYEAQSKWYKNKTELKSFNEVIKN